MNKILSLIPSRSRQVVCTDWTDHGLTVALIKLEKTHVEVLTRWHLDFPDDLSSETEASKLGHWLRKQWDANKIPDQPVYASIQRKFAVLRTFQQSVVAGVDLAETVLLHAESRYAKRMDDLVVDFVPHASTDCDDRVSVIAAAVSRSHIDQVNSAFQHASISLKGIGIGELGIGQLHRPERGDSSELVVLVSDDRLDLLVSASGIPLISQTLSLDIEQEDHVDALDRAIDHMLSRCTDIGCKTPENATVIGRHSDRVEEIVAKRFTMSAMSEGGQEECALIRLCGLAAAYSKPTTTVNFLCPRRPPDYRAIRKKRGFVVAACLVVVLAAIGAWLSQVHAQLDLRLAEMQAEQRKLESQLEGCESVFNAVHAIKAWDDSRVAWSNEIVSIADAIGGNDQCYLSRARLTTASDSSQSTAQLSGQVRSEQIALEIADRLVNSEKGFVVEPGSIESGGEDPYYQSRFGIRVQWNPTIQEHVDVQK